MFRYHKIISATLVKLKYILLIYFFFLSSISFIGNNETDITLHFQRCLKLYSLQWALPKKPRMVMTTYFNSIVTLIFFTFGYYLAALKVKIIYPNSP